MLISASVNGKVESPKPERLVAVQPDVLRDAEHALGNLLQRIHHAARQSADTLGPQVERLQVALDDLEGLLELIFDYVSPVDLELSPVSVGRIADSLASQVRANSGADVFVGDFPALQISLDRRLLIRGFTVLGRAMGDVWCRSSGTSIAVEHDHSTERLEFTVCSRVAADLEGAQHGPAPLALAVARRLIELQGGELACVGTGSGFDCSIFLPAVSSLDDRP